MGDGNAGGFVYVQNWRVSNGRMTVSRGPGAELRDIFEICTFPDAWKVLFYRFKTLNFEIKC